MKLKMGTVGVAAALALSVAAGGAIAASDAPMTPELAAKSQMVRKQEEQRISRQQQKAAAEALKAERIRVYNAKQAVQQVNRDNSGSTEKPVH
jgi:hypothetical protein